MPESWESQYLNRITTAEQLNQLVNLTPDEHRGVEGGKATLPMAITPYYASLMDPHNINCPIRRQAIPTSAEITEVGEEDPLQEDTFSPAPWLVQNYPDRILFVVTNSCAVYCRHCSRRRNARKQTPDISEIREGIEHIASDSNIRDIVVSGGDPLTLEDDILEWLMAELQAIPHVEIVRLGTRAPVTMPQRITSQLVNSLKKYHPLFVNTHFNHPLEITGQAETACRMLVDAGFPVSNQTVLLRGVNDSAVTMMELNQKLLRIRVRPYYLYQCDDVAGIRHFRTAVDTGVNIVRALQGHTSGLAVPHFCVYLPGGGGKVIDSPMHRITQNGGTIVYQNYRGRAYSYRSEE